jgi:hypothetical protein
MSDEFTGTDLEDEDQPSLDEPTLEENQGDDEGETASFLDAYDLGDVPEEARPVAEATIKRLNAAYTRQRQEDTQVVREAQQAEQILDGLLDPQRRDGVAKALGLELTQREEEELDDEFELRDPRVDQLKAEWDQERQVTAAEKRVAAENAFVTEEVEKLQGKLDREFSDEELDVLLALSFSDQYRDERGVPSVESAFRVLDAAIAGGKAAPKPKPKPKPKARRMGGGSAGERTVDLSDPEARKEVMLAAWRHAKASSE